MVERPDLEKAETLLETCPEDAMGEFYFSMLSLLTYCRKLEAENKRLEARCVALADEFQIDLARKISTEAPKA